MLARSSGETGDEAGKASDPPPARRQAIHTAGSHWLAGRKTDSLTRSPPHNYPSLFTGGRDPSRVIPTSLDRHVGRSPGRPRLVGGRCSCLRPSTRKSNSNMLRWLPIGREAADVLTPSDWLRGAPCPYLERNPRRQCPKKPRLAHWTPPMYVLTRTHAMVPVEDGGRKRRQVLLSL